jgi:hypothetical protein
LFGVEIIPEMNHSGRESAIIPGILPNPLILNIHVRETLKGIIIQ